MRLLASEVDVGSARDYLYELSAADKGCLPPLISRDVGWCSVDGQLQDGTVYGHLNC